MTRDDRPPEEALARSSRAIGPVLVASAQLPEAIFDIPIVMIPGAFAGGWIFARWQDYFARAGWVTHAITLRGHGDVSPDREELIGTRIQDHVDDVQSVLEQVGSSVLIGHSMGGLVAQKLAEQGHAQALVLVASVGPAQLGSHDADFPPNEPVDYREDYAALRDDYGASAWFDFALAHLVPESPTALNDCRGRTPVNPGAVTCPVLCVGGGQDETHVFPAPRLAAFYGADSIVAGRSHHDVMIDSEALAVAAAIHEWLLARTRSPLLRPWRSLNITLAVDGARLA
jgi:pimeloyl-ACP methyl ester carboxylesterase